MSGFRYSDMRLGQDVGFTTKDLHIGPDGCFYTAPQQTVKGIFACLENNKKRVDSVKDRLKAKLAAKKSNLTATERSLSPLVKQKGL
jgi:hypothetical protein